MVKNFTTGKRLVSILVLMLILIVSMLSIIDKYYNWFGFFDSVNHNESVVADTVYVPVEVPINEYENYEEGDGDEESSEEKISAYSLSSLWENPANDEKIIQDLTADFVGRKLSVDGNGYLQAMLHDTYCYFGETSAEDNQRILDYVDEEERPYLSNVMKIKDEVNREPNKIKSVFYTYKYLFYKSLPKRIYYKTDIGNLVDMLILSYKDIHTNDDPKKVLTNLQKIAFSDYDETDDDENLLTISEIISDDYEREYRNIYYGNGSKVRDEDLFWAYTFWARRHKENNVKEVYDILVEVQNYYAE